MGCEDELDGVGNLVISLEPTDDGEDLVVDRAYYKAGAGHS